MKKICMIAMICITAVISNAQQIDSIVESFTPGPMVGMAPTVQVAFDFYVSDTTNIDSFIIKMGYQSGGGEMFSGSFASSSLVLFQNPITGSSYYHLFVLNTSLLPRFVVVKLRRKDGSLSPSSHKRLVQ